MYRSHLSKADEICKREEITDSDGKVLAVVERLKQAGRTRKECQAGKEWKRDSVTESRVPIPIEGLISDTRSKSQFQLTTSDQIPGEL